MNTSYYVDNIESYKGKINEIQIKIVDMERELEQLRNCCDEHNQSNIQMENDITLRLQTIQNVSNHVKQIKAFKKFQLYMVSYLQSNTVQNTIQNRRQTNMRMQKTIIAIEQNIIQLQQQSRLYEEEIRALQYQLLKGIV